MLIAVPGGPQPVKLLTQIHDELLFEVDTQHCDFYQVAGKAVVQVCFCRGLMHVLL